MEENTVTPTQFPFPTTSSPPWEIGWETESASPITTQDYSGTISPITTLPPWTAEENIRFTQEYITPSEIKEQDELITLTNDANRKLEQDYQQKQIYNLTLRQILRNLQSSFSHILYEILTYQYNSVSSFLFIFTKEARMMYIGIFLIICSIMMSIFTFF